MRPYDWTGFAALGAVIAAVVALVLGETVWALGWFVCACALGWVTRRWSVRHPEPMPHRLRWTLLVPRGNHSPRHLHRALEPESGERILEVGPGIGIHAIAVAAAVAPDGALDVVDVQERMLDDVRARAAKAGITNLAARRGNAEELPYADATFDGAYLVGVLGEIPNADRALRELRRVLKPTGRLVVGEVFFDSDFVFPSTLRALTAGAGFVFERRVGSSFSYLARFRPIARAAAKP